MTKWEYKVVLPQVEVGVARVEAASKGISIKPECDSIAEVLRKYGSQGWEMVSVVNTTLANANKEQPVVYFKRPAEYRRAET